MENVWDYPRPPALEPVAALVRIEFAGRTIAETTAAWRVLETSHPLGRSAPLDRLTPLALPPYHNHSPQLRGRSGLGSGVYDPAGTAGPAQSGVNPAVPWTAASMAASASAQASSANRNRCSDTWPVCPGPLEPISIAASLVGFRVVSLGARGRRAAGPSGKVGP